ncbi:MAG: Flp pilus assembly complex ATPase component TadA, partial [Gammaproteobacteria bacterium]|nr:Flp pilus assembly complex ATPase component TadA [Gammaproteobacteria bacterium]
MKVRRPDQKGWHPVELLGEEAVADASMPGKKLTIEALVRWLSEKSEQPFKRIDPLKIDAQVVTKVMSSEFAQRHGILAVGVDDTSVEIVSAEPYVSSWEATIGQSQPGKRIVRFVANPADIRRYSAEFYTIARSVSQATAQGFANNTLSNLETMLELGELDGMEASDGHIVNIVDWLLQYAFTQRASDIHIEPRREKGKVRFRIDGVLHTVYELPSQIVAAVVSRVKSLGRMDVAEKRRPQDGRLKTRT